MTNIFADAVGNFRAALASILRGLRATIARIECHTITNNNRNNDHEIHN